MKKNISIIILAFMIFSCSKYDNKNDETLKSQTELQAESSVQNSSSTEISMSYKKESTEDSVDRMNKKGNSNENTSESTQSSEKPKYPIVTFIELGSVNCVPCKRMQPIIKSLESKYGEQLKVVFYDVWKTEFKSKASEYKIKLIPTQVFLDQNGNEIHRHEGFYPEEEIDKFLNSKGLKIINKGEN